MGTYGLSAEEIADVMEDRELEWCLGGDFHEEEFLIGAKEYINRLRRNGAFIYSRLADGKKQMCKICGRIKPTARSKCPNGCKITAKTERSKE